MEKKDKIGIYRCFQYQFMQGLKSNWRIFLVRFILYLGSRIRKGDYMAGKILIVDDQFGIRILLNEVIMREGYETYQAANGIQALDIVQNNAPDLILLDMKIPGMDGIEILKR